VFLDICRGIVEDKNVNSSALTDIRAICLDMEGVIIDSELHWRGISSEFLAEVVPNWDEAMQKSIHGLSVIAVHKKLVDEHHLELSYEEFLSNYKLLSTRIYGELCSMLPGVEEYLQSSLELPLALVSSAPRAWLELVLERFELRPYFSVVVTAEDVNNKTKPFPDSYLLAASKLELPASNCLAVEDSAKGVKSAKAAGMRCVGYRNGFNQHQDLSGADVEIDSFEKLRQLRFG